MISNKLEIDQSDEIEYSINSLKTVLNEFCNLTKEGKVNQLISLYLKIQSFRIVFYN
jgi:hypothetical protein